MTRGSARCLALLVLPLLPSLGCDALVVRPFAGTVAQLTLSAAQVSAPNSHLELWARDQYNDIIRLNPYYDETNSLSTPGLMITEAIPLDSPCMIDSKGNLLTDASAYPTTIMVNGTTQTPQEQANAIVDRLKQLNPSGMPLLAIVPWTKSVQPTIPAGTAPAQRLASCQAYEQDPLAYVPNPLQVTNPIHGAVYGFVTFSTVTPPTNYDGYRLDMPVNLRGIQELFFTVEGNTVDPDHRGPLYLVSTLTQGGNGVIHFDLTAPAGSTNAIAGTAALYVDLDQAPAVNQF